MSCFFNKTIYKIIGNNVSNKMSYRSIGDKYSISYTTVLRFFKRFCQDGRKLFLTQSGRKKKLQSNEILRMKRIANENPFLYGREVRDEAMLNRKSSIQKIGRAHV